MTPPLIDLHPDHWAIVRDILQTHVPQYPVWAFGSRATWKAKEFSDLDLAIITEPPLPLDVMASLREAFSDSDLPWKVDVVDWASTSAAFREIIARDKVVVQEGGDSKWKECSLGDVIQLKRGYDLPQKERLHGSFPLISSSGVTDFHSVAMVKGPGVVTGRYGTLGKVFYVKQDFWPLNTTLYVRDFKKNNPLFISYFLRNIDFLPYSDKAAVPGLNRNHLHEAKVRFPTDTAEQRAIAHVLGTLDDKIDLNRRTNATLEAMARALFKDWFVDFGPTRAKMEGLAPYLAPELWALFPDRLDEEGKPEGWEAESLNRLIEFNPTERLKKGSYAPYLDMAALPMVGANSDAPIFREFTSGTRFRNGDTLFARITPCLENGKTCFVQGLPDGVTGWGSTEFVVMRSRPHIPASVSYLVARDPMFRTHAIQSMTGTSGRQRARVEALEAFPIYAPDKSDLWEAFAGAVKPIFEKIVANDLESRTLAQTRDLLLPKLMSGAIRLNPADFGGVADTPPRDR